MSLQGIFTLVVLSATIALFVWDRLSVDVVAMMAALGYALLAGFERDQQGAAHLVVRWELRDSEGEVITSDGFRAEEDAEPSSIRASVRAQSRTVAALSGQIAEAIQKASS